MPAIGSSTVSPRLVKNSMNSCAIVSGNLAGWTSTPFLRGGGLWMNQDFWNLSQVFGIEVVEFIFHQGWESAAGIGVRWDWIVRVVVGEPYETEYTDKVRKGDGDG